MLQREIIHVDDYLQTIKNISLFVAGKIFFINHTRTYVVRKKTYEKYENYSLWEIKKGVATRGQWIVGFVETWEKEAIVRHDTLDWGLQS